ncbi:MAG: hypothetical protein C0608_01445 [Deltaproteobacteria bacterium]|nr:MAG: hypothetical protein C0608_01445 [Deltaproteobacteria bacterium]
MWLVKNKEMESRGIASSSPTGESGGLKFISRDVLSSVHESSAACHPPPSFSTSWDSIDFLKNFCGGDDVTLDEIGLLEAVMETARGEALVNFGEQIHDKAQTLTISGSFFETFERSYGFGHIVWAMGDGTLSGEFEGELTITEVEDDQSDENDKPKNSFTNMRGKQQFHIMTILQTPQIS